ncbi:MAG TPA: OB-fold nucleic acid binding domain-containing protein, partial [Deferrisomatales bacterium]|nr:OB-fold nucleic acid binding domain-containing protein [Deferrisomatales bacterium]
MEDGKTNPIMDQRREKLGALREAGVNPFPNDFRPSHTAAEVLAKHDATAADALGVLRDTGAEFALAGRVMALRSFGKAAFVHLQDRSGRLQAYVRKDVVGPEVFEVFQHVEVGDFVGVVGPLFRTRTEELTVEARLIQVLTKSLRPLPEKWHGLTDRETRYRQRYVDLIV